MQYVFVGDLNPLSLLRINVSSVYFILYSHPRSILRNIKGRFISSIHRCNEHHENRRRRKIYQSKSSKSKNCRLPYWQKNATLQRQNTEISKQIFPEKEYRGLSPYFHVHASVSDLYIPTIGLLPTLLHENMWTDLGIIYCKPLINT
jgi:hypothetical protein